MSWKAITIINIATILVLVMVGVLGVLQVRDRIATRTKPTGPIAESDPNKRRNCRTK
jgi:hypothetical protein